MAVHLLELGPNSCCIDLDGTKILTSNVNEVMSVATEWLNLHGWATWDRVYDEDGELNYYVLRAPMIDDVSIYKYLQIHVAGDKLSLASWESWNKDTHVGVNNDCNNKSGFRHVTLSETGMDRLYIFASWQYLFIASVRASSSNNYKSFYLLSELSKDVPEEVTGDYPRWVTTDDTVFEYLNLLDFPSVAVVGTSGSSLSMSTACRVPVVTVGTKVYTDKCTTYNLSTGLFLLDSSTKTVLPHKEDPFNPNRISCYNLYAVYPYINCIRGRLMGIKMLTMNSCADLSTVEIPCDEIGMYNKGGEVVEHWLITKKYSNTENFCFAFPK